jgi:class 3 adenylate cyclase/tetratricopeptide (TPR) repeat protein
MARTRTLAVVFTDLVGSTALASNLGPVGAERLRQAHFAALRDALNSTGGEEVKNLGDGLMVAYDGPSAALDGAVAIQQAIFSHNRTAEVVLAVRVGVAVGEADEEDGDFFGSPVVEAARLCAAADGGQILATDLVRVLAGRHAGHEFVGLGALELKGLPEPVACVEVRWEPAVGEPVVIPLPGRLVAVSGRADFVGRSVELADLADVLKEARVQRRCRVVLLGGEPGIGKTTLAAVFACAAHAEGSIVLYGRCDEDLGIPYQSWAEAIGHLVDHAPPGLLDEVLVAGRGDLARLGPSLAHLAAEGAGGSADAETARYLLFGAVLRVLEAAGGTEPVVLVLDDLQWADAQTLQLLRHLVGSDQPVPVVVVVTFRVSDLSAEHALADVLAWLHGQSGVTRLNLRGLGDTELLALMESRSGHTLGVEGLALRDALSLETDGNPFFVGELLSHLAETGAIYQDADGRWTTSGDLRDHGLPVSVREVIGRRVAHLGPEAVRVLSVAAVIGRDFDLELLATSADTSEDLLLDVLDAAVVARLVVNVSSNRYSFEHALVEHALYQALTPGRRARLHRRVAESIEDACGGDFGSRVGELAYHYSHATIPADLSKALSYAQAAGDRALAQLAPSDAFGWYEQALSLLDVQPHGDERLRAGLLVGLGNAERQMGKSSFRETLLSAGRLARQAGDTNSVIAAALVNNRGLFSLAGVVDVDRVALIEAALTAAGESDSIPRARLLGLLALERTFDGDYSGRRAIADAALAMARRLGDPATLLDVLLRRQFAIWVPDSRTERMAETSEAEALADRIGDPVGRFWGALTRMIASSESANLAEYDRCVTQLVALADTVGQPTLRWNATFNQAMRTLLAGHAQEAEVLLDRLLTIVTDTGEPDVLLVYGALLIAVRWHQGRGEELVDIVATGATSNSGFPLFRAILARTYADAGRYADARQLLDAETRTEFSLSNDPLLLGALTAWAETAASLGDAESADILYEKLLPWPTSVQAHDPLEGVVAHYLGQLATVLDRYDDAHAHFTQALTLNEGLRAPFPVARTHLEWGRMLLTRSQPTDAVAARTHLEIARDLARRYQCLLVEQRAIGLLGRVEKTDSSSRSGSVWPSTSRASNELPGERGSR